MLGQPRYSSSLATVLAQRAPRMGKISRKAAIFAAPLSASKHEALQALFRDGVDPVLMALGFARLEHDDL